MTEPGRILTVTTGPTGKPTVVLDGAPVDPTQRLTLSAAEIAEIALAYGAYGAYVGRAALAARMASRAGEQSAAKKRDEIAARLARLEARPSRGPVEKP